MSDIKETIKIYSEHHYKAVQERLFELGYSWHGFSQKIREYTYYDKYLCTRIGAVGITRTDKLNEKYKVITLEDLYKREVFKVVGLNLTSDYTAKIYPEHIKVGCQEIPNKTFEELVELYNKAHKK